MPPLSPQQQDAANCEQTILAISSEAATWAAKKRKRSDIWDHYDVVFVEEGNPKKRIQKGKCKRCSSLIAADSQKNGTSALRTHYGTCRKKFINQQGGGDENHDDDDDAPRTTKKFIKQGVGEKRLEKGQTILKYFSPVSIRLRY